jgi:hypothetical protein
MLGPPRLWTCLTTDWCPLPPSLAWTWWRALVRAQWSTSVEWRDAFLVFARRPDRTSAEMVGYFFTRHCAPHLSLWECQPGPARGDVG